MAATFWVNASRVIPPLTIPYVKNPKKTRKKRKKDKPKKNKKKTKNKKKQRKKSKKKEKNKSKDKMKKKKKKNNNNKFKKVKSGKTAQNLGQLMITYQLGTLTYDKSSQKFMAVFPDFTFLFNCLRLFSF